MNGDEEVRKLLTEIRDLQREHLAEYRKVAERSLDLQNRALTRQEQIGSIYRRTFPVAGVIVLALLVLLAYLLARWSPQLFG